MSIFQQKFRNKILPLIIIGVLFFIFGLVSWVNAILIPYFKIACELTHTQAYLVALAFYIAYLVMAIPASKLLNHLGFKKGMMFGLWLMALGTLLFIPAAYTRTYGIFLTGLFSIGTGLAVLQTAVNPYITIIGPIESAAHRISIMGLCNKFAGIISPLIFAVLVLREGDSQLFSQLSEGLMPEAERIIALDELIRRVIPPYSILTLFLFLFGIFIRYSPLPEIDVQSQNGVSNKSTSHKTSIFQFPYLIFGALAIFFHVGSQVIAIDTIIGYAETMGLDLTEAKTFPSYTMVCTLLGYLLGILLIPKFLKQRKALQICVIVGMFLSLSTIFVSGSINLFGHQTDLSIWFLVLLGMPNALVYAGIWPLAIRDLGKFTNLGSSLLVMGLCGNAFLPVIYGMLADQVGVRLAYWVLIPCFIYLIFYAFYGYKIENWNELIKKRK